jgi:DNA-binding LacI/PurR family transcriptional regulator
MKEIAEFLGLHYSTVSRALSRGAGEPAASGVLDFKT